VKRVGKRKAPAPRRARSCPRSQRANLRYVERAFLVLVEHFPSHLFYRKKN
jgi:hypothetical protein